MSNGTGSWWSSLIQNPGVLGRVRRQWSWVVVLVLVLVGLILIALGAWRWGAGAIGVGMIVSGVFRTFMKSPGILVIRGHKWIDLSFYYGLGIAIVVFAILVPNPTAV